MNPPAAAADAPATPLTARMLNEFVYCPRLFYYEQVEGVFVHSADTLRGAQVHRRVDSGSGKLPPSGGARPEAAAAARSEDEGAATPPTGTKPTPRAGNAPLTGGESATAERTTTEPTTAASNEAPAAAEAERAALDAARERGEIIHSRSVWLSSERHNVNAKLDLVESREAATSDGRRAAIPVDYKKGAPREGEDANEIWDADRIQLGVQMLVLRENGYDCAEGIIYYQQTRQRVRLAWTAELAEWIERTIAQARACEASPLIPPPLIQSPKCPRCSLVGVCLPDETAWLATVASAGGNAAPPGLSPTSGLPLDSHAPPPSAPVLPVRRLMAERDDRRALYLNTPGLWVGLKSERLVIKDKEKVLDDVRLQDVNHLALFGNIQLSTQAIQQMCEQEIPVSYFSMGGWFYGLTHGHGLKNVQTRIAQFRRAADPPASLALARQFIHGKIRNQRTLLMRNHVEPPEAALLRLRQAAEDVRAARTAGELLGMEGAAAAVYFGHFAGLIKVAPAPGPEHGAERADWCSFDFNGRNRRPPRDAVNALLSLAYSLLTKDCTLAALAVGFDPYVGFFHQPRAGRPALALDLLEEFRPLIADSAVITALNNRMVEPGDFLRAGDAVSLTSAGRRRFFTCYEKRMSDTFRHPVFDYQVSYRRGLEVQARLLAKTLTGEIPEYRPLTMR